MNRTDAAKIKPNACKKCGKICGVDRNGRKHKCKCGKVVTCR